jgi:hypothetical protein
MSYLRFPGLNFTAKAIKTASSSAQGIALLIMISVLVGSLGAFWLSLSVLVPLWASIGGMIVFLGLWLEKEADNERRKEHLSNLVDNAKRVQLKATLGWWLLMAGIAVETLTAFALAVRGEKETRQIKENAAKNDPLNQPISDMSATAILIVMGTDFNDPTNMDIHGRVATMTLWNNDKDAAPVDSLNANNFTRNDFWRIFGNPNSSNSREYGVRFHSFNFRAFNGLETPVKTIDDVRFARMEIYFLPHGSAIAAGGVDLVVNNTHRLFQIDTNRCDFKNLGPPYSVVATNTGQTAVK